MTILIKQAVRISGVVQAADTVVSSLSIDQELQLVGAGVAEFVGVNPVARDGAFGVPYPAPTYCILGDSLGSRHNIMTATNFAFSSQGPINWAMAKLHWPLRMLRNAAVGGYTTAQMLAALNSQVLKYRPGYCFIHGGGWNDISQGVPTATIVANMKRIVRELLSNGVVPIFVGMHAATAYSTAASKRAINAINSEMRLYLAHNGGLFIDTYSRTLDTSTGGARANYLLDGTHFATRGAQVVGENDIAPALAAFLPPSRPVCASNDYENIILNPLLLGSNASGTNGFNRTGFGSGSGPNACTADILNATGSTLTNPAARTDGRAGQTCVMNLTLSAAHGWGRMYQSVRWGNAYTAGTYTVGACRRATTANGAFYCVESITGGGATAGGDPTGSWTTTPGELIVDGEVTWRCFRAPVVGEWYEAEFEFAGCVVNGGTSGMPVPIVSQQNNAGSTLGTAYANYFDATDADERYPLSLQDSYTFRTPPFPILAGVEWLTPQLKAQGANSADLTIGCQNYSIRRVA